LEGGLEQCYLSKAEEGWLWHKILGHIRFNQIHKSSKLGSVRYFPNISLLENTICKSCQFGKQTWVQFKAKEGSTSRPLELIHTDLSGLVNKISLRGEQYFILFIDNFTRMCWIGLSKYKDESFDKFKVLKYLVESESDLKIKCLRSDKGGEYISNEFFDFCEQHGIKK